MMLEHHSLFLIPFSTATMGVDNGLVYGDAATLFDPFLFISHAKHVT